MVLKMRSPSSGCQQLGFSGGLSPGLLTLPVLCVRIGLASVCLLIRATVVLLHSVASFNLNYLAQGPSPQLSPIARPWGLGFHVFYLGTSHCCSLASLPHQHSPLGILQGFNPLHRRQGQGRLSARLLSLRPPPSSIPPFLPPSSWSLFLLFSGKAEMLIRYHAGIHVPWEGRDIAFTPFRLHCTHTKFTSVALVQVTFIRSPAFLCIRPGWITLDTRKPLAGQRGRVDTWSVSCPDNSACAATAQPTTSWNSASPPNLAAGTLDMPSDLKQIIQF